MVDDAHFAFTVADVSGKGVPAALFMVIAKTLLKDAAFSFKTPAEIFAHVNNTLCEGNESGLFVTCWLGILEISTGKLTFANAAHTAPVISKNGEVSFLRTKPNLMLAAMEGLPYKNHEIFIYPGDKIFVYTDRVTEACDSENQLYGDDRLLSVLKKEEPKSLSPKEILDFINSDIEDFVSGADQFDDITMMAMFFKKKDGETNMKELKITAEDRNMERVNDFIHSCLPSDCTPILMNKIDLAIEEIFVNIASYAYGDENGMAAVYMDTFDEPSSVVITFEDSGIPYNPLAAAEPDINAPIDKRRIGGLGIFLVRQLMDSITYERVDGKKNVLSLTKHL
jgi:sigma-B regulation protein RsbU (phosphoserine phosphatase)